MKRPVWIFLATIPAIITPWLANAAPYEELLIYVAPDKAPRLRNVIVQTLASHNIEVIAHGNTIIGYSTVRRAILQPDYDRGSIVVAIDTSDRDGTQSMAIRILASVYVNRRQGEEDGWKMPDRRQEERYRQALWDTLISAFRTACRGGFTRQRNGFHCS